MGESVRFYSAAANKYTEAGTDNPLPVDTTGAIRLAAETITANGGSALGTVDAKRYQSVMVQVSGVYVGTLQFEVSNNAVDWVSKALVGAAGTGATTSTTGTGIWAGDIGARYFRVRASAWTSGTANITAEFSGTSVVGLLNSLSVSSVSPGSSATNLGKAEDNAAASGDTGVAVFGVRGPTTAVAATSAAGDYGTVKIDAEGNVITKPHAIPELQWQFVGSTAVNTSQALRASAGAGLRNYVTDLTISNSSATGTLATILDNTTVIWQAWIAPGQSVEVNFVTPLKGTAATALNFQSSVAVTTFYIAAAGFIGV